MTIAISAKQLAQKFGDRTILNSISFDIKAGSFFIIIGPNGSGKTTLIKLLAGLTQAHSGDVQIMGQSLKDYKAKDLAKLIAYVPQNVLVEFSFSVTDIVLMGRAPHLGFLGVEGANDLELAKEAMEFTDVAHLADRRMNELSGGERQRVFIARAICQRPKVLLLDEPTSALDLSHQGRVMDLMEKLKIEHGITVVMISHELNLAAMYADQLLMLSKGNIAQVGTPYEVLEFSGLKEVYGCNLLVDESPIDKYPRVHLIPGRCL